MYQFNKFNNHCSFVGHHRDSDHEYGGRATSGGIRPLRYPIFEFGTLLFDWRQRTIRKMVQFCETPSASRQTGRTEGKIQGELSGGEAIDRGETIFAAEDTVSGEDISLEDSF
ncbi:MAG: hypothetical protein ACLU94_00525 [Catenibacillus sp.]